MTAPVLLLNGNFSIPPLRPAFVRRPRLTAQVSEGLTRPLTVNRASTGIGKTAPLGDMNEMALRPRRRAMPWRPLT